MKRCCYFFASFVAAIFLSVATGTFEPRTEQKKQPEDALAGSVASQDNKEQPTPVMSDPRAGDPFKKPAP